MYGIDIIDFIQENFESMPDEVVRIVSDLAGPVIFLCIFSTLHVVLRPVVRKAATRIALCAVAALTVVASMTAFLLIIDNEKFEDQVWLWYGRDLWGLPGNMLMHTAKSNPAIIYIMAICFLFCLFIVMSASINAYLRNRKLEQALSEQCSRLRLSIAQARRNIVLFESSEMNSALFSKDAAGPARVRCFFCDEITQPTDGFCDACQLPNVFVSDLALEDKFTRKSIIKVLRQSHG